MKNSKEQKVLFLKNGIKLINIEARDIPYSVCSFWFPAGSKNDPEGKEGLAHLVEHLLLNNTKKYPSRIKRYQRLESLGINANAFVNREFVCYHQIGPQKNFYHSLDLLIDGVFNPLFSKKSIGNEKNIIQEESLGVYENQNEYIWHLNTKTLYPGSDFSRDIFQEKESLNKIEYSDVLSYYKNHYSPDEMIAVCLGDQSTGRIKNILNKIDLKNNKTKNIVKVSEKKQAEPKKINIVKNKSKQITVSLNFLTTSIERSKKVTATDILRNYLADNWSSVFIKKLRLESDITYWVESDYWNTKEKGYISFIYSVKKENLEKSIKLILKEINKLKKSKNLSIDTAKNILKADFTQRISDPLERYSWVGENAIFNNDDLSPEKYLKILDSINSEYIVEIANRYLKKENFGLSLIGDVDKSDFDNNILNF